MVSHRPSYMGPLVLLVMIILVPICLLFALFTHSFYKEYLSLVPKQAFIVKSESHSCPGRQCVRKYWIEVQGEENPRIIEYKEVLQEKTMLDVLVKPNVDNGLIRVGSKKNGFLYYYWQYFWKKALSPFLMIIFFIPITALIAKFYRAESRAF